MEIRDIQIIDQEIYSEGGRVLQTPVRRVAACASVKNPLARKAATDDHSQLVDISVAVGEILTTKALQRLGSSPRAFGKAAVVGTDGDLEHAAAMIHVRIGLSMRRGIRRGNALIPGNAKVGLAGTSVDLIFGGIDDSWDYDAMDTMPITFHGSPRPDEVLLVVGFAGNRPNARIRGASFEQVTKLVKDLASV